MKKKKSRVKQVGKGLYVVSAPLWYWGWSPLRYLIEGLEELQGIGRVVTLTRVLGVPEKWLVFLEEEKT